MADEWEEITLRDASVHLLDCDHKTPSAQKSGRPYIAIPQLKAGRIDATDARTISEDDYRQWTRKTCPQAWDVVVSRRCNPGETAFVPPGFEFALGQNLVILRSNGERVFEPFLRWLLRSPAWWEQVNSFINVGAVFESLKCADIPKFRLPLPPMREQHAIACILGALDDKIELNRRRNRTLEGMARAIFQSWFVDFDPVKAKAAGRNPPGLSPEFAAHFPNRLAPSPLGPIPAGWRSRPLPDVCDINPARALPKGTVAPYLDMSNMPTRGPSPESWIMREAGSGMKFINGDTLVARITPCLENGKTALVDFLADDEVGWGSTEYIVLRPRGEVPSVFAYLLARSDDFRAFAIQQMSGSSGRQRVPADTLTKYFVASPNVDSDVFRRFAALVCPMFDKISSSIAHNRTLAAVRDALLPKLISGELRVPDAERIVGRMT